MFGARVKLVDEETERGGSPTRSSAPRRPISSRACCRSSRHWPRRSWARRLATASRSTPRVACDTSRSSRSATTERGTGHIRSGGLPGRRASHADYAHSGPDRHERDQEHQGADHWRGPAGYTAAIYAARANLDADRDPGPAAGRPAHHHHRRRELSRLRRRDPGSLADGADGGPGRSTAVRSWCSTW